VVSFLSMSTSILQPFKTLFQIHEQAAAAQHPQHGRQTEPAKDEPRNIPWTCHPRWRLAIPALETTMQSFTINCSTQTSILHITNCAYSC
jgi:hypothetical protein